MMGCVSVVLVLTLQIVILNCHKRDPKSVYKPFGIVMCRELCQDSTDTFFYNLEHLSCHQLTNGSGHCYMEDRRLNLTKTGTYRKGLDVWNQDKPQPEHATEAKENGDHVLFHYNFNMTLHQACEEGRLDVVKYILSNGLEDINCLGKKQRTPVMVAARKGQIAVFDYLISQGCDLPAKSDRNRSVLHLACCGGSPDIVRKLVVNHKCDINSKGKHDRTPIMYAAYHGHRVVFDLLVKRGCDLHAVDDQANNILHHACVGGHVDMVSHILLQSIFRIDCRGHHRRTPVMMAAVKGNKGVFVFLQGKGCDLAAVDNGNNNILHLACFEGRVDMVKYILLQNIISLENRGHKGKTPVLTAAAEGEKKVFDFLVERGCDLGAVDKYKNNILHLSSRFGRVDLVKHILTRELVSIESRGQQGRTALMQAVRGGHREIVDLFHREGCNLLTEDDNENTILHVACIYGHLDMVKYLLTLGVVEGMVKVRNKYGETPVHAAAQHKHGVIVRFLKKLK